MRTITTLVAIAAAGIMLAGCDTSTSDASVESLAQSACEKAVKNQLKSPSTAEFEHGQVNGSRDSKLLVVGRVDSQNGFGATVRSAFTCSVTWDEAEETASARVINLA